MLTCKLFFSAWVKAVLSLIIQSRWTAAKWELVTCYIDWSRTSIGFEKQFFTQQYTQKLIRSHISTNLTLVYIWFNRTVLHRLSSRNTHLLNSRRLNSCTIFRSIPFLLYPFYLQNSLTSNAVYQICLPLFLNKGDIIKNNIVILTTELQLSK